MMLLPRAGLRWPASALGIAIAALLLMAVAACSPAADTGASATNANDIRAINLPIVARSTTADREQLQVKQGQQVRLAVTADEPGELHLHGYDLTAAVSPGAPATLDFAATTAGAFAINFHVFASDGEAKADDGHSHDDGHSAAEPEPLISDAPVDVSIRAEVDDSGGVDVHLAVTGMSFDADAADQPHVPGAGHAHIYVDGVKVSRVFADVHRLADLPPGEREIMVSLNTNDHRPLVYQGQPAEDTITVTVPDVGQSHAADSDGASASDDHDHDHDHGGDHEIVAEVHLGNLEIYP